METTVSFQQLYHITNSYNNKSKLVVLISSSIIRGNTFKSWVLIVINSCKFNYFSEMLKCLTICASCENFMLYRNVNLSFVSDAIKLFCAKIILPFLVL